MFRLQNAPPIGYNVGGALGATTVVVEHFALSSALVDDRGIGVSTFEGVNFIIGTGGFGFGLLSASLLRSASFLLSSAPAIHFR